MMTTGLLIEDDETYAYTLKRALERHALTIHMAHTATTGLELANSIPFDFVLVDIKLGNESGMGLIAPLRAISKTMKIILVTGYASVATAVEAIKRGADNYVPKPVTANALLRLLFEDHIMNESDKMVALSSDAMTPLNRLEWEHIQQALQECNGNISAAARLLGMHRRTLQRKLTKRPTPEN